MKTTTLLLCSILASVSAKAFRGWKGFHEAKLFSGKKNTTEFVIHGELGPTHCEEVFIPSHEYKSFLADPSEAPYKEYKTGLCPIPFTTIDSISADGDFPDVTHLKRGRAKAGASASLSVSNCGGSASGVTYSYSSSPSKGGSTTITGKGTIPSGSSGGQFVINALIGDTALVNNVATNNCKYFTKSIFLVGTIQGSACPDGTGITFTVTIPVPNISGKVTATLKSSDGSGNLLLCAALTMNL